MAAAIDLECPVVREGPTHGHLDALRRRKVAGKSRPFLQSGRISVAWRANAKRVYRMYCEEGLQLRNETPKRKISEKLREDRSPAAAPNEVWAMNFMSDQLFDGRRIRILATVDPFSLLSPTIDVRQSFRGSDALDNAESLIELDVNPVIVRSRGNGAIAVDVLMRVAAGVST